MFRSSAAALRTSVMKAAALSAYNKLVFLLRPRHSAQQVPEPRRSCVKNSGLLQGRGARSVCGQGRGARTDFYIVITYLIND